MKVNCLQCQSEFSAKPAHIRRGWGKFCSDRCKGESMIGKPSLSKGKKRPQTMGVNHHNWVERIKIKCKLQECDNILEIRESDKVSKKFCNKTCQYIWRQRTFLGENNPFWKGGKTPIQRAIRLSGKYQEWRQSILKRDDFTCKFCDQKGGNNLEVDHIQPFGAILNKFSIKNTKQADDCAQLWDTNNGRVLCTECHKKTESYALNTIYQVL